jgi:small subunit ribosomal protein S14
MAKKSSIEKNNRRRRMTKQYAGKRSRLKAIVGNHSLAMEERVAAQL